MSETATAATRAAPVAAAERVLSIDTLRGVAVLGILVMNIYAFAMPFVAYNDPLAMGGTEWYNLTTWYVTHIVFDQKFLAIFSILFGAGLVMMMKRADARGAPYTGAWFRRNAWLLLIGALHGYLLWFGDILFQYAVIGMLIFPFRHSAPRVLITVAAILLGWGLMVQFSGGVVLTRLAEQAPEIQSLQSAGETLTPEQEEILEQWVAVSRLVKPPEQQIEEDVAAYTGDYASVFEHRLPLVWMMQTQATFGFMIWRIGGLMLLGMALMKLGVLSAERSPAFYRRMLLSGYGIGLPILLLSAWMMHANQWEMYWLYRVGLLPNYVGSVFVALGHIALVMRIVKSGIFASAVAKLTAVGRMAFTNYLMHSIVLTTVFYGYGLGLYAKVPRIWQMAFVAGVIGFQLWFSPWWLDRYRYGPAEWLWRSLTYGRAQPMRRATAA